jgi:hypothetical protein
VPIPISLLDAFGRQRVSNPVTLFDSQSQYDALPLIWQNKLGQGGTATHRPAEASVRLETTAASGDEVIRQTREYFRYQPGKSQMILITFAFGPGQANCRREVGYGDAANGVFLREQGGVLSIVLRSSSSGQLVETVVPRGDWNAHSSVGPSVEALTVDPGKAQIFGIDLEWLGVGRVRTFFVIDGEIKYAHIFDHANVASRVYMTTANLPVRYRIANLGAVAGGAYMDAICASVVSEGGFERGRGVPFAAGNGGTLIGVTTRRPICSIRPRALFNSIVNRAEVSVLDIAVVAQTNPALIEVVYNGALTGASFVAVNADNSTVEVDVAATTISGGIVVGQQYVAAAAQGSFQQVGQAVLGVLSRLPLALDIDGANPIALSVVATSLNATSSCGATANWQEMR